jgi:hypothetical protein
VNIAISSYHFYPELTPRAFRTFELVKEFCREGHHVTLYLPKKTCFTDEVYEHPNLKVVLNESIYSIHSHYNTVKLDNTPPRKKIIKKLIPDILKQPIKKFLEWKMKYFYPIRDQKYIDSLSKSLIYTQSSFEIFISIALPIEPHVAAANAFGKNKKMKLIPLKIAEYGDPFSRRKASIFFYYYFASLIYINFSTLLLACISYSGTYCLKNLVLLVIVVLPV